MIEVRNLTKVYEDPDGGEVVAVANASLSCAAGQIYGLLGPNGAGKTTTLRCLATVLTPTSGTAIVNGHDIIAERHVFPGDRDAIRRISVITALTILASLAER